LAGRAVAIVVCGVSLSVLLRGWLPGLPAWELVLATGSPAVDGISIGRMTPHSAATFIAAGLSLLFLLAPARRLRPWETVASLFAVLVMTSGFVAVVGYAIGGGVLAGSRFVPMAASTALLFVLTGAALLVSAHPRIWSFRPAARESDHRLDAESRRFRQVLAATFLLLTVGVGVTGFLYSKRELGNLRSDQQRALAAIADLKADEVAHWRSERLADALLLSQLPLFPSAGSAGSSAETLASVRTRAMAHLLPFKERSGYSWVEVFDADQARLMAIPPRTEPLCPVVARMISAGLPDGSAVMTDPHHETPGGGYGVGLVVSIDTSGVSWLPGRGFLVLHSDVRQTLFPTLQRWPGPSQTGEILLARRDGTGAILLAGSAERSHQARELRLPYASSLLPGETDASGVMGEGLDYRGTAVLTASSAVSGSPWIVVAKIDRDEVYELARERVWTASVSLVLTGLGVALGLTLIRRQRDAMVLERELRERRRREEAEQSYRTLFREMLDGFALHEIICDENGAPVDYRFLAVNPAFERLTGLKGVDIIGRTVSAILPGTEPHWIQTYGRVALTGEPVFFEEYTEPLGRHFQVTAFRPEPGQFACIFEDVTERKRTQTLLIQTEKMMSLAGMAAGIAHEINNPLGIIRQAVDNVDRRLTARLPTNLDAAARAGLTADALSAYIRDRDIPAFLDDIRAAAARANEVVSGMLQFARKGDSGRSTVDLSGLLEQALVLAANDEALTSRCDLRAIRVTRAYQPDMPPVSVVPVEIEQALLNLLANAGYAMAETAADRPPALVLRVYRDRRRAVIQVEDNGPGIAPDVRQRIFEPFFTTKPPGAGTGLGLSVAFTIIVQNHGGTLDVESEPGRGTCFTIGLPLTPLDRVSHAGPDAGGRDA
ncbi:MAG: ATP-binding protein, partial [Vicinamibacterales bacterium]|nr:ATP-binding protein [Vicinamibacterales bacterium]